MTMLRFDMSKDFNTVEEIIFELITIAEQIKAGRRAEGNGTKNPEWEIWEIVDSADD